MKEQIKKERLHLFAPRDILVTHVEAVGIIFEEKLREALKTAVSRNELLNARVVMEKNGEAYFETQKFDENPNEMLRVYHNAYWKDIVREQETIAFDLDHGELLRFFYLINEEKQEFLIIAHALAGDGISHGFFLHDVLRALSDQPVDAKPLRQFDVTNLPKESALSLLEQLQLKGAIRGWRREGADFSAEEYYQLHMQAWKDRHTLILYETFHKEALYRLALYAKKQQVTLYSVILTTFAMASRRLRRAVAVNEDGTRHSAALQPDDIALVLSLRGEYNGMGDYEYTYPIQYLYDDALDFAANVRQLHACIRMEDDRAKYRQLWLLDRIPPQLADSMQFQTFGRYVNPVTEDMMKRFGISSEPRGMAVTNLVKVPLAAQYGSLRLCNYVFVPPVTANARRIIGISTYQGVMNLSFHVTEDDFLPNSRLFYQTAVAQLRSL